MNLDEYEIDDLTEADVEYIWEHIDELTRTNLGMLGYNDVSAFKIYLLRDNKWVARHKGIPFVMFGFGFTTNCIWPFYIGSADMRKHVRFVHRLAPSVLNTIRENFPGYEIITEMWEGKQASFNWHKHLGFEFTGHVTGERGKRFVIMRYGWHKQYRSSH